MKTFNHFNVKTIEEALGLLKKHKGKAKVIAGGTDLLCILKDRILPEYPEAIINIKSIMGLNYIEEDSDGLKIGALTSLADIVSSDKVNGRYKVLAEAAHTIATPQIRYMATIGGNLCQDVRCWYYRYPHQIGNRMLCLRKGSGPCLAISGDNRYHAIFKSKGCVAVSPSDLAVALTALNAMIKVARPKGDKIIPVRDFLEITGNVNTVNEIVSEIQVPRPPEKARQTFLKFTLRRPIDFSLVSIASILTLEDSICKDASIALGGVALTPIRASEAEQAIIGRAIDVPVAKDAAEAAMKSAVPLSMNAYKVEIGKSLVKRAILT